MTKPRVTVADRLSNIIEVVELGRRSGLLTVERGANQTLEQGEVYFVQGRAIYALVEGLRGREALAVLGGWGQCRFAFEPTAPRPAPNVSPAPDAPAYPSSAPMGSGGYAPQRDQPSQSRQAPAMRSAPGGFNWDALNRPPSAPQPPNGYGITHQNGQNSQNGQFGQRASRSQPIQPMQPMQPGGAAGSPHSPMPSSSSSTPSSTPSSYGVSWPSGTIGTTGQPGPASQVGQMGQSPWPVNPPSSAPDSFGQTGWFNSPVQATGSLNPPLSSTGLLGSAPSGALGGAPISAQTLQRRPRRAPDVRDLIAVVSAYNLSRNHRTILLLADGEHTVLDLTRLSSKSIDEIVALLADLERLGLVYYY